MKKVYAYRLHRNKDGLLVTPEFIENGGYFFDGYSYLAVVPSEEDRKYYVPDTLEEISLEALKARLIALQNTSEKQVTAQGDRPLTDAEVIDFAEQWWATHIQT